MSTTQSSAEHSKSRLRGDMYLRAEQRKRDELAAAQLTAIRTPVDARVYGETAANESQGLATSTTATDAVVAAAVPAEPIGIGIIAPIAATPKLAASALPGALANTAPASDRVVTSDAALPPDLNPPAPIRPIEPVIAAPQRRVESSGRRRRTLVPAAALGAVALVATLGVALTLSPGQSADDLPAPVIKTQASAPAATPVSTTAPARAAAAQIAPATPVAVAPPTERTASDAAMPTETQAQDPPRRVVALETPVQAAERPRDAVVRTRATATTQAATTTPRALDGQIRITSTPPGARVTVDGIGWGQTPVTIRNVSFGTRTVRLTQDGYASQQAIVQVSADTPSRTVDVVMRKR